MITKISMKNVASYKDETTLETDKRINLIYGLNGTGKTQISKFLANQEDENFKDCNIEGLNNEEILVYNQDFIEKNFYNTDKQQGIFTLSEENITIKQEIENLQKKLIRLKSSHDENEKKIKEELNNLEIRHDEAIKNLWEHIGKKYAKKFENFFENIKTKKQLHDALLHRYEGKREVIVYHNEKETYTGSSEGVARMCSVEDRDLIRLFYINEDRYLKDMEEIEKKYNILMDMQAEKTENIAQLSINKEGFLTIENNNLFREKIIGNQNNSFAKLINKLDNQSWVKNGFDKYIENSEICPFCQTKGVITHEFKNQLTGYFNKGYEEKIESLMELKNRYKILLDNIPKIDKYYRNKILDEYDFKFKKLYNDVVSVLFNNLKIIDEKIKAPNEILKFSDSEGAIEQFNNYIIEKQQEIIKYNELMDNKNQNLLCLKEDFWDLIMQMNIKEICDCREMFEDIKEIKYSINDEKEEKEKIEREIKIEIIKKQENIINIQKAVDKINNYLKDLGILNFYIKAQDDEKQEYIIVREGENKPSFKTLSEGEKTLISFLYFLQLCQGKKEKNEINTDKIIMIDDPISSLSFNYIYDIAQLIKHTFFKNTSYRQIFILTHNLYFYHEFFKIINKEDKKNNISSFRIFKNQNNYSCISVLDNEILNDYQAYWQILKDYKRQKTHKAIIPITMRNILENFVGFVYIKKLIDIINEYFASDIRYKAFYRYISRESHSDIENISDIKEIDINMFFEAFENFFKKLDHEEHYKKMMETNND